MNRRAVLIIFIATLLSLSLFGCEGKNQVIIEDFNKTVWESDDGGTSLLFIDKDLFLTSDEIKPEMDPKDIDNIKYESNKFENIEIILNGKSIEINNEDGLIMEFKKVSDTKIKDSDGTVFIKKDIN